MFEPRRWWDGPLDVELLAWTAVAQARDAAADLVQARARPARLGTDPALIAASFAAIEHLRVDGRTPAAWAPMSGFFSTADGWVRLHANYPHHAAALTRALGATTREDLTAIVAERTALDIEDAVTRERGIAAAVRTPHQWLAHPHGTATANDPWAIVETRGTRRPLPTSHSSVLDGIRVVDLTRVIAGPTCSQLLACLGADVLRIDPPSRPELLDQHLSNGMGKRSAAVDLTTHHDDLNQLLATADVVLLGYRPGSLRRFGLDPDDLCERHPHLVVASLSAWGEHGPWAERPGFDSIVQAACGIATRCSTDASPGALPVQALDHATGYVMSAHVMQLLARRQTGIIRLSLLGAARTLLAYDPPPRDVPMHLPVTTVEMASPHGQLTLAPPPLTVNGQTIECPIGAYGRSPLTWRRGDAPYRHRERSVT